MALVVLGDSLFCKESIFCREDQTSDAIPWKPQTTSLFKTSGLGYFSSFCRILGKCLRSQAMTRILKKSEKFVWQNLCLICRTLFFWSFATVENGFPLNWCPHPSHQGYIYEEWKCPFQHAKLRLKFNRFYAPEVLLGAAQCSSPWCSHRPRWMPHLVPKKSKRSLCRQLMLDNLRSQNCLTYSTASLVFGWQFSPECQSDIQNIVLLLIGAFNQQPAVCRHTKPEIFCIPKKNVALFAYVFWVRLWMLDTVAIKGNFFMNSVIFST